MSITGIGRGRIAGRRKSPLVPTSEEVPAVVTPKPYEDPKPGFSGRRRNFGVSAALLENYLSLDGKAPDLIVEPGLTRGMGLNMKKIKTEDEIKPEVKNVKLGTSYANDVLEREKQEALLRNVGDATPMEVMSCEVPRSSTNDLDAVSTTFGDANHPDPDWMNRLEQYFDKNRSDKMMLQTLPISSYKEKIITTVKVNRVTIIEGPTGCGKTTQVPQYIADECYLHKQYFNIVVTQPRRIAAITVAKRVCNERDWDLGGFVGYQVGLDRQVSDDTRILYCTTGVLLQKLIHHKNMSMFTHIIIDEVHERDSDTDLLLMVVRKYMWMLPAPVKLIIMSATFDTEQLKEYFGLPNPRSLVNAAIMPVSVTVAEKPHKLTPFYMPQLAYVIPNMAIPSFDLSKPYVSDEAFAFAVALIGKLDNMEKTNKKGAVLVFLPGLEEINEMITRLKGQTQHHYYLLPLHSSINIEEQRKVFDSANLGERKIIVATNIAESSITVPDVEYVIDFCLTKILLCDPDTNYPVLRLEWASQANCDQRAGRAGRVKAGRVYRMITADFYAQLPKYPQPELLRTPLETSVLRVKMLDLGPPKDLLGLCISPPDLSDVKTSILRLKQVGALTVLINNEYDPEDGNMTTVGEIMAALPIDVQLSRLILLGHAFGCLDDCMVIAACLSMQNMFSKPYGKELDSYKSKLAWADRTFSDLMAFWNAFYYYRSHCDAALFTQGSEKAKKWCEANYIQYRRIKEVEILYKELKNRLEEQRVFVQNVYCSDRKNLTPTDDLILKVVICGAFYPNFFMRMDMCVDDIRRVLNDKDPCSTVKISNLPANKGVLYVNAIRDLFKDCSDQIDVEFEETHALLTFSSDHNPLEQAQKSQHHFMTGNAVEMLNKRMKARETAVKTSVYVAIKMRQVGIPLSLRLYKPDHAERKIEQLQKARDSKLSEKKWLRTNRFSVPALMGYTLRQIKLPSLGTRMISLWVTEVMDCGHFYAHYQCEETKDRWNRLRELISEYLKEGDPKPLMTVRPGMIVLAIDNSGVYNRAQVFSVDEENNEITLFFPDFGSKETKQSASELLEITPESGILDIEGLAFECVLSEIRPSDCLTHHGGWHEDAKNYFIKLVYKCKTLSGIVYSVVNRVVRLQLLKTISDGRVLVINDDLITRRFAEKADESPQSRLDHEQRQKYASNSEVDSEESFYSNESSIEVFVPADSTDANYSTQRIKIRGPYTPIEATFQGITRLNYRLKVNIERDSVNSVCLEPNPDESNNRLLVAAHVGLSGQSGRIYARNSTLMPSIRGFASIMALLFCPTCELRLDSEKTCYTGVLCGLGYDPKTKRAYNPDNDIEMPFDVIFTPGDLGKINTIRLHLNDLFASSDRLAETTGHALSYKSEVMRERVLSLLRRKRASQTVSTPTRHEFKWGVEEPYIWEEPTNIYHNMEYTFLKLHKTASCVEDNKWAESIKENQEDLRTMLEMNINRQAHCKACNINLYTPLDLNNHLSSEEHRQKVVDALTERGGLEDMEQDDAVLGFEVN